MNLHSNRFASNSKYRLVGSERGMSSPNESMSLRAGTRKSPLIGNSQPGQLRASKRSYFKRFCFKLSCCRFLQIRIFDLRNIQLSLQAPLPRLTLSGRLIEQRGS